MNSILSRTWLISFRIVSITLNIAFAALCAAFQSGHVSLSGTVVHRQDLNVSRPQL
jgi:hypothetical protein